MNIGLLSICFFRYNEINESLQSILNNILPETNLKLGLINLPSPNLNKVLDILNDINHKNKHIYTFNENNVSSSLISITLNSNFVDDIDYIAITETDIRLLNIGTLEKCCDYLKNDNNIGYISPEYDITSKYHEECYKKYVLQRKPYKNILCTTAQGFQLLVFRKNDWINYCNYVKNGNNHIILDTHICNWFKNKVICILNDFKMVHTGWDVYKNPSSDKEYLEFKNNLIKSNNLWKPSIKKGNELIEFKEL